MATDADKATGDYTVITRDDGKKQWAFKGKPLYFWAKDTKPATRPATVSTRCGKSPNPDFPCPETAPPDIPERPGVPP